ncbi:unnamed protein product, partial [Ixodes pacificus]
MPFHGLGCDTQVLEEPECEPSLLLPQWSVQNNQTYDARSNKFLPWDSLLTMKGNSSGLLSRLSWLRASLMEPKSHRNTTYRLP